MPSEDDSNWPEPDRVGKQELEIVIGGEHISFSVRNPYSLHGWTLMRRD